MNEPELLQAMRACEGRTIVDVIRGRTEQMVGVVVVLDDGTGVLFSTSYDSINRITVEQTLAFLVGVRAGHAEAASEALAHTQRVELVLKKMGIEP